MVIKHTGIWSALCFLAVAGAAAPSRGGGFDVLPDNDILMKALVDELERSMSDLFLAGLAKPYFIQYHAEDRAEYRLHAAYGALVLSNRSRSRSAWSRVRVGSFELDNTNYGAPYGGRTRLPLDDDYVALRHAVWRMTDSDYKRAAEVLTSKQGFLKQKNVVDRPDDYSAAPSAAAVQPSPEILLDRGEWERRIKTLSARFAQHQGIQDSDVSLFVAAENQWVVNSEGTRLRTGDTGVYLLVRAEIQAEEGMLLADSLSYMGEQVGDLPDMKRLLSDVDEMCERLVALSTAPVLEEYTGPILFEPAAAGRVFETLMSKGLCARPVPLGRGGWDDGSLEKKIGRRILPRSFNVYDDPGPKKFGDAFLGGAYDYDDEAVAPKRTALVEHGILKTLLASRAPTKKISGSTGHGMSSGYRDPAASIGCLYVEDEKGLADGAMKEALIQAAKDEGLDYALRIASLERGGGGSLGDPVYAYKVYVDDGREELVRGTEFKPVETRSMKHILAAGARREVYNSVGGVSNSYIVPALLFEELELSKTEEEFDKLPILDAPASRERS